MDNKTFLFIALYDQQHIINYYVEGILRDLTSTHIIEYDLYKSREKPFIYTLIIIIILYIQKIE